MRFKLRSGQTTIDAVQFSGINGPLPHGVTLDAHGFAACETPAGTLDVAHGDWIVPGPDGVRYPMKPDVFNATYEPI